MFVSNQVKQMPTLKFVFILISMPVAVYCCLVNRLIQQLFYRKPGLGCYLAFACTNVKTIQLLILLSKQFMYAS
jgi:hypothetical protein